MKKLLIAAAAAAVTGGVFASPLLYDYKASVKHMYLKEIKVNVYKEADVDAVPPVKGIGYKGIEVYLKYITSASLKGVLVMDQDGATSPIVSAAYGAASTAKAFDYGRNRGFLIVENSKAAKNLRYPKIIPAVLDAKYLDTAYSKATMPNSGLAEGYLYLGGDAVACVRTQLDDLAGVITDRAAAPVPPAASTPGMAAIADYRWTSIALFGGQYNGPNWFYDDTLAPAVGPFDVFETAWDGNLPAELQIGFIPTHPYYHDTWMNGSGFGKYRKIIGGTVGKPCCGLKVTKLKNGVILDTLSGSVKGGVFLCTENLIHEAAQCTLNTYHFFDDDLHRWEDQFNTARLTDGSGTFAADAWQNDLWQDGFFEQETTDVISGTWSIKYNATLTATDVTKYMLTVDECKLINAAATANTSNVYGMAGLCAYLNFACWYTHGKSNKYTFVDGTEISDMTPARWVDCITGGDRLPVITPKFAEYYGLFDWN